VNINKENCVVNKSELGSAFLKGGVLVSAISVAVSALADVFVGGYMVADITEMSLRIQFAGAMVLLLFYGLSVNESERESKYAMVVTGGLCCSLLLLFVCYKFNGKHDGVAAALLLAASYTPILMMRSGLSMKRAMVAYMKPD
jgi:hypothetical protein